jgi:RNA polymerase sigma factor (sigma-70 family)
VESSSGEWLYVDELLDRLDARERQIVELSIFAGSSAVEIGGEMGLTPGAVRQIKSRALGKLRAIVGRDVTLPGV